MSVLARLRALLRRDTAPRPRPGTHQPCPNSADHVHVNRYGRWECIPRTGRAL